MPIARMLVELRIPTARSLKDRRQVVRSLKDRLRHGFNLSVAELDETVLWQSATIGIVAISCSRDYLRAEMEIVEQAVTRMATELGAEIEDCWWEFVEPDASDNITDKLS
jgi:hypothetical protein